MTQKHQPDLQKVQQTSVKIQEVCQRADAGISILDDLISQLESQINTSPLYRYRSKKS
ncbi:conserved hypothetical protein [Planktothrix sp. PCC 11201]|uniref:hypothetical protein n=1 Tax=Planktothrix sp. PCC 11201 TaxID=1729650 RepID=UPI000924087A|nr:hypothetical protein [Planktothrix sp. PCC 11201]SKB14587.1 conserved hypothetical protein [Planktothrix sp. PCC 11201]